MNFKLTPMTAIGIGALVFLLMRRGGLALDMADVKPSVQSFVTVGIMATTFILLGKYLTETYHVKGLTALFQKV